MGHPQLGIPILKTSAVIDSYQQFLAVPFFPQTLRSSWGQQTQLVFANWI